MAVMVHIILKKENKMLHKKNYVEFARVVRKHKQRIIHTNNTIPAMGNCDAELQELLNNIIEDLVELFRSDNPAFDADKFLSACEIKGE
jgi:hypothetical protein